MADAAASTEQNGGAGTGSPPTAIVGPTPKRGRGSERSLAKGTLVGRYVVLDRIGAGGMGVVYSAYDPDLNRKVAIKLVRARSGGDQARLLREAQALARLQHPNVVALHDVGTFEERMFLAMELVEGQTLSEWWEAKQRSWRDIVSVFVAAGEGLAAAHDKKLVHRDFKPANVLVGSDGRVRVTDFGLARGDQGDAVDVEWDEEERLAATPRTPMAPVRADSPPPDEGSSSRGSENSSGSKRGSASSRDVLAFDLTRAGAVMGTPAYMAPETYRGEAGEAADQFGFAVSLYQALYHQLPFENCEGEARWAIKKPPPGRDVHSWLHKLVVRGLAHEPTDRFASMRDFVTALDHDPSRRRRRIALGIGAAAVVSAGVAFATMRAGASESALCQGAEQKLAGIWDGPRKALVKHALAATGSVGTSSWPYLEPVIDRYAQGWVSMHKEACLATRAKGEQSEQVLTLRMTCLERRRVDLDALVEVLGKPTAEQVIKSIASANQLPPLSYCADVEALRAPVPPPANPALRARADVLYKDLARARVAGDLDALRTVAAAADQLAWAPLVAEAYQQVGELLNYADTHRAASAFATAAVAALAANDHRALARALLRQADALAGHADKDKDATLERNLIWARAVTERLKDPALRALQLLTESAVLQDKDSARAVELAEAAVALLEKEGEPNATETGHAYGKLALAYFLAGRTADQERSARRAVEILTARLGQDHSDLIEPLEVLYMAQVAHMEVALATLERIERIARAAFGAKSVRTAEAIMNKTGPLSLLGRSDEAVAAAKEAHAIYVAALGGEGAASVSARLTLGAVLKSSGRTGEEIILLEETVRIMERVPTPTFVRVEVLTMLAEAYQVVGNPKAALATAKRGVAAATSNGIGLELTALIQAGRIDRVQRTPAEALALLRQARAISERNPVESRGYVAHVAYELGETYLDLKQPRLAAEFFDQGIAKETESSGGWKPYNQFGLARVVAQGGDRTRAVGLAKEALQGFAASTSDDDRQFVRTVTAWLAKHGAAAAATAP